MELLEGGTLKHNIGKECMSVESMLNWAIQITEGLDAAHIHGLIHRDLKPANLFITTRGAAKILDFGLARHTAATTAAGSTMSISGNAFGTPAYMSPEQVRGEKLDIRTDLFSLGAVFYEMVTGTAAFPGRTSGEVAGAILYRIPAPPSKLNPKLPSELERIIQKALQKDCKKRYASASELRTDLERVQRELAWRVQHRLRRKGRWRFFAVGRAMRSASRPRSSQALADFA